MEKRLITKDVCVMNRIKIYNTQSRAEINIDDSVDWVIISPYLGVKPKHFRIDFKGFDFARHSLKCDDCKSFIKSFGKLDKHWFLQYNGVNYKLIMEDIGKGGFGKNEIKHTNGLYEYGTNMVLSIMELDLDDLEAKELESVLREDYTKACFYRDLSLEVKNV